jgi:hypothetical protein
LVSARARTSAIGGGYLELVSMTCACRTKGRPPEGGLQAKLTIVDQATVNTGFDFQQQAT